MTDLDRIASEMSHLWAKDRKSPRHLLFDHLSDVCRQAAQFYNLYAPKWPLPDAACLPRILAYSTLLHDFGKVHPDFQRMLREPHPKFGNRHEILSLAFLPWLSIPDCELPWVAAAVASHHKNLGKLLGTGGEFAYTGAHSYAYKLAIGVVKRDANLLHRLLLQAAEMFRRSGWSHFEIYSVHQGPSHNYLASIASVLDQTTRFVKSFDSPLSFGFATTPLDWPRVMAAIHTRGWLLNADHLASFGNRELRREFSDPEQVKHQLLCRNQEIKSFSEHQEYLAGQRGSACLVSPTGSGKTEAGMLWAAAQARDGVTGRSIIILPYQASMNAMQQRIIKTFFSEDLAAPDKWNEDVALVHGRATRKIYESLLEHSYAPEDATRTASRQSDLARLNAAPISICSPFALIKLLFATHGAEGLLAAFTGARLIFDEIHAYEPDVTAMSMAVLRFLLQHLNARVLLMTATLPSHLREALNQKLPELESVKADSKILDRAPRHRLKLLPFDSQGAPAVDAITQASQAGSVLVVVNQVKRAYELYQALRRNNLDVKLLHSRFNYADRAAREKDLTPVNGRILVSTQAVEVSLDIDYDVCFTELAPAESLLQRFGRCNRYGKQSNAADVFVFSKFPAGQRPYLPYCEEHVKNVLEVLSSFANGGSAELHEREMQNLIDNSYPPAMRDTLQKQIVNRFEDVSRGLLGQFRPYGWRDQEQLAKLEDAWSDLFDGEEVLPECLVPQASVEATWLGRARYLVPISHRRFLRTKPRWSEKLLCYVTEAPYDPELGLDIK